MDRVARARRPLRRELPTPRADPGHPGYHRLAEPDLAPLAAEASRRTAEVAWTSSSPRSPAGEIALRASCPSTTRSTSSTPRAPPGSRSASCTAPAARCSSTSTSTSCMCDVKPGRPRLLLHHLRLDDVELAGLGAGLARRRCCCTTATPSARRPTCCSTTPQAERMTLFGTSAKYIDALSTRRRSTRCAPTTSPRCARITSTGSPLAPEGFDYVYEHIKRGHLPVLDRRRHRHRRLLRLRQSRSGRCGAARSRPAAWAWRSTSSTTTGNSLRGRRASWSAPRRSRRCRSASGTTPTAPATAPPTSSAFPACGGTATSPRSPSTAA